MLLFCCWKRACMHIRKPFGCLWILDGIRHGYPEGLIYSKIRSKVVSLHALATTKRKTKISFDFAIYGAEECSPKIWKCDCTIQGFLLLMGHIYWLIFSGNYLWINDQNKESWSIRVWNALRFYSEWNAI